MHHKFIDQYSDKDSFLHERDPRCKIVVFLVFLFLVLRLPLPGPGLLTGYGAMLFLAILFSGLPWAAIARRILTILPFVFLAGWSMFSASGTISAAVFLTVLIKASYAIITMFLLVSTTEFPDFLAALEWFRCPQVLIRMLSFLYRYIYLLLEEFMKMRQAQASRTVVEKKGFKELKSFSSILAHMFVRSYEKGEMVYLAMAARGYRGNVATLHRLHLHASDYVFGLLSFLSFSVLEILCRKP